MEKEYINKEYRHIILQEGEEIPDNFYPVVEVDKPNINDVESYTTLVGRVEFNEEKQVFERRWTQVVDKDAMAERLRYLHSELANTDYKIIKNMEAQMAGIKLPYEPKELYETRQPLRDEINKLKKRIENV